MQRSLNSVRVSGGSNGKVVNFDLTSGEQVSRFQAALDTVNGFQFHPFLPLSATASGEALKTVNVCCGMGAGGCWDLVVPLRSGCCQDMVGRRDGGIMTVHMLMGACQA